MNNPTFAARLLCVPVLSASLYLATAFAQPASTQVDSLIALGDNFSTKQFNNEKALEAFLKALTLAPNSDEILWRISRAYVDIGEHLPVHTDEEKQKQLETYEKSLSFAEKAIVANPKSSMAFTRRAIANGRIALFKGVWDAPGLVKQTKADCETAITLDSSNAAAFYVLGRTHAKVSEKPRIIRWPLGLSWANLDDAVTNYERAISLRPGFIMYRLDYARTLIEQEKFDKAREQLTTIGTLSTEDEDDSDFRKEAKDLIEEIKGK
ncbi:MAG: tetratricopeptide repeat protein [Bacteroidota bacterium]